MPAQATPLTGAAFGGMQMQPAAFPHDFQLPASASAHTNSPFHLYPDSTTAPQSFFGQESGGPGSKTNTTNYAHQQQI